MPINFKTVNVPATLEDAVNVLYYAADNEERSYVLQEVSGGLHHGLGQDMRNDWGLWHGSVLKTYFMNAYGLGHADDMSGLILDGLYHKINGTNHNIAEQVEKYKKHWKSFNTDPLTLERIN